MIQFQEMDTSIFGPKTQLEEDHMKLLPAFLATHLVAYCDSCGGKNKNFGIVSLWSYLVATKKFTTIDRKFPVTGHSFLRDSSNLCSRLMA